MGGGGGGVIRFQNGKHSRTDDERRQLPNSIALRGGSRAPDHRPRTVASVSSKCFRLPPPVGTTPSVFALLRISTKRVVPRDYGPSTRFSFRFVANITITIERVTRALFTDGVQLRPPPEPSRIPAHRLLAARTFISRFRISVRFAERSNIIVAKRVRAIRRRTRA